VHLNDANNMAVSGLGFRKALVDAGWAVSLHLCTTELREQTSHLIVPPFLALKVFQSLGRQLFAANTDY